MKFVSPDRWNLVLLSVALIGLVSGSVLWLAGYPLFAKYAWTGGVIPVLLALFVQIIQSLKRGDFGLDIVAALSARTCT